MSIFSISVLYLISAVCFILSLKGLSSPASSRSGNFLGITGMSVAIIATFLTPSSSNAALIITAIALGAFVGYVIAYKIEMTAMPQLVAGFHSLVGLAAVLISICALISPESFNIGLSGYLNASSRFEMIVGASIGAITFTGSIIAFAKLQNLMTGKSIKFQGQQIINIFLTLLILYYIYNFTSTESHLSFAIATIASLVIGVLLIIPVGGADMPVVVSMLNSYSGWAASGIGFTLGNNLLVITGALVGASGAILSYVMCSAMNRSLYNVIFGAFMTTENSAITSADQSEEMPVKSGSAEDAAYLLGNATNVIIVPGYGMAVAQAQHVIKELHEKLCAKDINVKYAVHPVAGRMPGHMNVLLAEANISYEDVYELEDINNEFSSTDVVLVVGANDVTNPAAKEDPSSPIYGMPILNVDQARSVLFIKRSMSPGYSGIENKLFYKENTMMLFGDAKKLLEEVVKQI